MSTATETAAHGAEIAHLERLIRLSTETIADLRQQVSELKSACAGKDKEIGRLNARLMDARNRAALPCPCGCGL